MSSNSKLPSSVRPRTFLMIGARVHSPTRVYASPIELSELVKSFRMNRAIGCPKTLSTVVTVTCITQSSPSKSYVPKAKKPHNCPKCDASFRRPSNLADHDRTVHTGERLFECPICDKTYSSKQGLRQPAAQAYPFENPTLPQVF